MQVLAPQMNILKATASGYGNVLSKDLKWLSRIIVACFIA
jgi:hypothetical protein